ncbi:hypothetical protein A1Q2_01365 [Trichosporon asahii var. asahii CBS 8904]|uniref:Uncharacterized protein n=1 Tax=Trichosporon asahii var. asahii (strain CBS 8904) TaxID=1220162 RepID=K1WTW6_TRIAC|nr:hypothetical protein A1Q2_01365 [Trichosporon asahii var. asahii CBS 8904]
MMALYTFLGVKVFKNGANLAEIRTLFDRDLPNTKYKPLSEDEKEMVVAAEKMLSEQQTRPGLLISRGKPQVVQPPRSTQLCRDDRGVRELSRRVPEPGQDAPAIGGGQGNRPAGHKRDPEEGEGSHHRFKQTLTRVWAGGTYSVLEDEIKVSNKGVTSYETRSAAKKVFHQEDIVKGKLVLNDDGFVEYNEAPKYNAMLRGGQTADVEEWIVQACETSTIWCSAAQSSATSKSAEPSALLCLPGAGTRVQGHEESSLGRGYKVLRSRDGQVPSGRAEVRLALDRGQAQHGSQADIRNNRGTIWNNLASALPTHRPAAIMLHLRHDHVKEIIRKIMRQQLLGWSWGRLEFEAARAREEKGDNITGLTLIVHFIVLRTGAYSVMPEMPMGQGRYTTLLDDVYMCIINEEEDGSIRHDTKRRIGQVLRDGERVLELQDWIADATEPVDLEEQLQVVLGKGRFAGAGIASAFSSALCKRGVESVPPTALQLREETRLQDSRARRTTRRAAAEVLDFGGEGHGCRFDWKAVSAAVKTRTPGAIEKHVLKAKAKVRKDMATRMGRAHAFRRTVTRGTSTCSRAQSWAAASVPTPGPGASRDRSDPYLTQLTEVKTPTSQPAKGSPELLELQIEYFGCVLAHER